MSVSAYSLGSWTPAHDYPTTGGLEKGEKGAEHQRTINAPDDATALKEAENILSNLREVVVGILRDQGGRVIARCYTLHSMSKVAWDDPPETIEQSYSTFFAQRDQEAKGRYPAENLKPTSNWEQVSLYGPDGFIGRT